MSHLKENFEVKSVKTDKMLDRMFNIEDKVKVKMDKMSLIMVKNLSQKSRRMPPSPLKRGRLREHREMVGNCCIR